MTDSKSIKPGDVLLHRRGFVALVERREARGWLVKYGGLPHDNAIKPGVISDRVIGGDYVALDAERRSALVAELWAA